MDIVIIGAGYAGILTTKKLARRLKKLNKKEINLTIIDKNPFHTMLTELHEVAASRVDEESIKISLDKIFAGRNVNVVLDTVTSIDFENRRVIGKNKEYAYDYLVLAAGSKPTYFNVAGVAEHAFKLWSYEDAVRLRDHIHNQFRKAVAETNPDEKKKMLNFNIVGSGFTGVEMAGELAEYVPILCEKFNIDKSYVTIRNIDVLPRTCPMMPENVSKKVERRLNKMGVEVLLETNVVSVDSESIVTEHNGTRTQVATNTVIWAAGVESADITQKAAGV
ncbi:MAG TPA: FAD-dependent oxidoreductase, partial [Clostridia bacterium]|nr:FAD-dependent oxidoreductase [Clostridia bacterium]